MLRLLVIAALTTGCYASHGRSSPDELDASVPPPDSGHVRRDGGRDAGRDAGRDGGPDAGLDADVDAELPPIPDSGLPPGTIDGDFWEYCYRYSLVFCANNEHCCTHEDRVFAGEGCVEGVTDACTRAANALMRFRDRMSWNVEGAERWLRRAVAARSTCAPLTPPDASEFVIGSLPRGADCAPPFSLADEDERMMWMTFACEPGFRCALTGTVDDARGACSSPGDAGALCNTLGAYQCSDGLYCAPRPDAHPRDVAQGVCTPLSRPGDPCTSDRQCESAYCAFGRCPPASSYDPWCFVLS